jgi:4-alpha-glucanotransferase
MNKLHNVMSKRRAGVLLHPTSLPCGEEHWQKFKKKKFGTLGKEAYQFIDWLHSAGLSVWQMLPTGPTLDDMSPYQSVSAHAGNPDFISVDWLIEHDWVKDKQSLDNAGSSQQLRQQCAQQFFKKIEQSGELQQLFNLFCESQAYWLEDYVVYCALRDYFKLLPWNQWPEVFALRNPEALSEFKIRHVEDIRLYQFEQFAFYSQWQSLRDYAQKKSIELFGDIPIFVGHDSADVWANQDQFLLDESGNPLTVAGVPPDYFSEMGQHWGNVHYRWSQMEADGFSWWKNRFKTQLAAFDILRLDHFRALEAYWAIPGHTHDARLGQWVRAPGAALLNACYNQWPNLPLVAENLGVITDEVEALRHQFNLPGMLVMQFAFDGNAKNPHLPQHHRSNNVIYTGTHDNDTTKGWFKHLSASHQKNVQQYLLLSSIPMPWLLIEAALASTGRMTIIPMQDFLELDSDHRMNMPGTQGNNWQWTFAWEMVAPDLATHIRTLLSRYDRLT